MKGLRRNEAYISGLPPTWYLSLAQPPIARVERHARAEKRDGEGTRILVLGIHVLCRCVRRLAASATRMSGTRHIPRLRATKGVPVIRGR
jgi:hypothetical protein